MFYLFRDGRSVRRFILYALCLAPFLLVFYNNSENNLSYPVYNAQTQPRKAVLKNTTTSKQKDDRATDNAVGESRTSNETISSEKKWDPALLPSAETNRPAVESVTQTTSEQHQEATEDVGSSRDVKVNTHAVVVVNHRPANTSETVSPALKKRTRKILSEEIMKMVTGIIL